MERMRVVRKKMRQKVAGSWKNSMPITTAPTAPMPVHTGYTVPMGIFSADLAIRYMLRASAAKNPVHHNASSVPVASLVLPRQKVNAVSISPAKISMIQLHFSDVTCLAGAAVEVVVDVACGLEEGIAYRGAEKLESAAAHLPAHGVGYGV